MRRQGGETRERESIIFTTRDDAQKPERQRERETNRPPRSSKGHHRTERAKSSVGGEPEKRTGDEARERKREARTSSLGET